MACLLLWDNVSRLSSRGSRDDGRDFVWA